VKRFLFEIAYNGKHFSGWQRQPNQRSVQETIEVCLSRIYSNLTIEIVGCGRTDAGVHASSYFFHVNLSDHDLINDLSQFRFKLNRMLPDSISVFRIFQCDKHARFDAKSRTYRYFVSLEKDPFKRDSHLYIPNIPDFEKMNTAAEKFLGTQDFTSLSKLHTDVKTNICAVTNAEWIQESQNTWYFEITADRFLRNMVRSAVGTLLEVGRNSITPEDIEKILQAKNRGAAAKSVPAHGLFLWKITYDFNE
jgi:tRNA pseudouridine38-40 synthase